MSRSLARPQPPGDAKPVSRAVLHQTLLTGLLGGIGVLDEARTYLGARDARFVIAPGTPLQKRSPHWIVAASLVETHRLYARMVAQVQPSWIESAGAHLVRRTYGEAEWDARKGMAFARETVTLYGRVLSSGRRVAFATVDAAAARRMFVEEALVRRNAAMRFAFLERNEATRARLEQVEACLRRRDLLAGDAALVRFYLERIPAPVATTRAFEHWWRQEERVRPRLLDAPEDVHLAGPLPELRGTDYPASLDVHGNTLALHYRFDTTATDDGITLDVPLPLLRSLDPQRLEWLVPGWLHDKVVHLLRGLPKDVRREIVPIPEAAGRFLTGVGTFGEGSLFARLATFVTREAGQVVEPADVAAIALPPWLSFHVRVLDPASGKVLHESRDLDTLHDELRAQVGATPFGGTVHEWERAGVRSWDFGDMPAEVTVRSAGLRLRAWPGIKDEDGSVRLRLYTSEVAARRATYDGLVRLAALALPQQHEMVRRTLAGDHEFTLLAAAGGLGRELLDEIADRAVAEAVFGTTEQAETDIAGAVRTRAAFEMRVERGRADVVERGAEVARVARSVLMALKDVRAALDSMAAPVLAPVRDSVTRHVDALLAPGWIRRTPAVWWPQLPKYVRAMARRLDRARGDVARDRKLQAEVAGYETNLRRLDATAPADAPTTERERLRWMIEEFRLSLFAQDLRTRLPVSAKRLDEQQDLARREVRGVAGARPRAEQAGRSRPA